MKTLKLNFTVPEDVAETLKARVGKRKRSAFVAEALRFRLAELEREQLRQALIDGYKARLKEDTETSQEWSVTAREKWE